MSSDAMYVFFTLLVRLRNAVSCDLSCRWGTSYVYTFDVLFRWWKRFWSKKCIVTENCMVTEIRHGSCAGWRNRMAEAEKFNYWLSFWPICCLKFESGDIINVLQGIWYVIGIGYNCTPFQVSCKVLWMQWIIYFLKCPYLNKIFLFFYLWVIDWWSKPSVHFINFFHDFGFYMLDF